MQLVFFKLERNSTLILDRGLISQFTRGSTWPTFDNWRRRPPPFSPSVRLWTLTEKSHVMHMWLRCYHTWVPCQWHVSHMRVTCGCSKFILFTTCVDHVSQHVDHIWMNVFTYDLMWLHVAPYASHMGHMSVIPASHLRKSCVFARELRQLNNSGKQLCD